MELLTERYPAPINGLQVYDMKTGYGARLLVLTGGRLVEYRGEERYEHELPGVCQSQDAQASGLVLDSEDLRIQCHEDGEPILHTTRPGTPEVRFQTAEANRITTSFTDEVYPRLDPGAASLHSCGSGHFRELVSPPPSLPPLSGVDSKRQVD